MAMLRSACASQEMPKHCTAADSPVTVAFSSVADFVPAFLDVVLEVASAILQLLLYLLLTVIEPTSRTRSDSDGSH